MDAIDRRVKQLIGSLVVDAYGLPGHLRPCPDCGEIDDYCECGDDDE